MTKAPYVGTHYWLLDARCRDSNGVLIWTGDVFDLRALDARRVFRTQEARDAVQAAITKLLKGGDK